MIYIFLVWVFPFPSSDFSGRLKLLYYSPRVCQIPRQLQTHHPSLALCLRGNKVSGFPGWQICVIVLQPSRLGEQLSGHRRRAEKKGKRREKGDARGWQISVLFKVKIEFLWRGARQVVRVRVVKTFPFESWQEESHPSGSYLNPVRYYWLADKRDSRIHWTFAQLFWAIRSVCRSVASCFRFILSSGDTIGV